MAKLNRFGCERVKRGRFGDDVPREDYLCVYVIGHASDAAIFPTVTAGVRHLPRHIKRITVTVVFNYQITLMKY